MTSPSAASEYPAAPPLGLRVLVGALTAFGLADHGFGHLAGAGRTPGVSGPAGAAAALSAAACAGLYVWAAEHHTRHRARREKKL
ncbi:hypothetical protein [Streptomyces tagetis]|uniref:Uncharacterized protein n=1 Tax=Streptomyces tagetis TaxID=2820809 RepID=A0A940XJ37_9ACTN|nr:hypothetical protein [Streptomyces sp. RG38]MBQ0829320.1 hypothetical protein [Streptomyces sp. RG38]